MSSFYLLNRMGIFAALRHGSFRIYRLGFVAYVSGMQMFNETGYNGAGAIN